VDDILGHVEESKPVILAEQQEASCGEGNYLLKGNEVSFKDVKRKKN
jgi:hypothetical protein